MPRSNSPTSAPATAGPSAAPPGRVAPPPRRAPAGRAGCSPAPPSPSLNRSRPRHRGRFAARRPTCMPCSSESTSASQDASIMFSETPIEPHTSSPSDESSSTRVTAPVPFVSSRMRTLKLTRSISRRCGWISPRASRSARSSALHGAVALGGADVALAVGPDLDRRLGLDPPVGALLDDRSPRLETEQRLVLAGLLPQQQLERAVGGLVVVAAMLELLDALDHARGGAVVERDPGVAGAGMHGALARTARR